MERMQEACQESDAASERFVETFLSDTSGAAVDQFIKQYRDMRRLYYIRQAKLDRIQ